MSREDRTRQHPSTGTSMRATAQTRRSAPSVPLAGKVLLLAGVSAIATSAHAGSAYPHSQETIGTVRELYDGALTPDLMVSTLRNIDRLFPTHSIAPAAQPHPLVRSDRQITQVKFTAGGKNYDVFDYLALNRISGLLILKDGKIAYETYQYGNTDKTRWASMSVAKSITSTLIGAAIKDGFIGSINDPVTKYVPRLAGSAYDGVSVRDVLMMSSGVKWNETYTDRNSDRRHLLEAQIAQKPGGAMQVMSKLPRASEPGTRYNYSTGETQVVGEVLFGAIKKPLAQYLSEKIWSAYGMEAEAKWWIDSPNGVEIAGSGMGATLRDFGRFGQFILDNGVIDGRSILPDGWIADAGSPKVSKDGTDLNYGYLWWISTSAPSTADKAFFATGIFGQNIYINPKERVVIVTWGAQSKPTGAEPIPNFGVLRCGGRHSEVSAKPGRRRRNSVSGGPPVQANMTYRRTTNAVVVGFTRVKCPPEAQNTLPKAIERIRRQQV
jgi:CubicO group peptidase (beta-lactamase class C family)